MDPVLEAGLFEKYRDLVTVWRGPVIEIDHRCGCPRLLQNARLRLLRTVLSTPLERQSCDKGGAWWF
jgi:hypothetical protein